MLPVISGRIAAGIFMKIGYRIVRQRGSHIRLHHPLKRSLTIPDHKTVGKGLLRKILRDAELPVEDFMNLLKK